MPTARGEAAFLAHYQRALAERWSGLLAILREGSRHVLRKNCFADQPKDAASEARPIVGLADCYERNPEQAIEARGANGLRRYYSMDAASVVAARALSVGHGERVLDMCAAPGGKALVLAEALGPNGELSLNDRSKGRLRRLQRVLADYLPSEVRASIRLSCRDGRRFGQAFAEQYDAVLLDAPCSSERHVLADPSELAKWSPGRIKRLSVDQFALLSSAFLALKPGGRLVYSTCALLPEENDRVVERLLKRRPGAVRVEPVSAPIGEATQHGWQILPDTAQGFGPIYFASLTKSYTTADRSDY